MIDMNTPEIPAITAPDSDFIVPDPELREAAIAWARGVYADHTSQRDERVGRACKVLIQNSPEDMQRAEWLLDCLDLPLEVRNVTR